MQAKRFIAADMRRALDMVKNEFGEDAMILSTERTAKGVELVATVEAPMSINDPMSEANVQAPQSQTNETIAKAASRFQSIPTPTAPISAIADSSFERKSMQPSKNTRGLSSGKTQQQLADEMELANRKMLAAKKAESMTLEKMSEVDYTKPKMSAVENNEDIRRLHSEISEMRQHLQIQLSDMAAIQERQYFAAQSPIPSKDVTPATLEIRQYLSQLGLTQACNDQLMSSMKTDSLPSENKQMMWTEVLSQLARNIPYDASDMVAKGGIYAFLGTTGVGKTTTIAKLAARYVMENGTKGVVLLTTDNYRIASHNQLKSLASILNIPVKVVETLEELPTLLKGLVDHQLILIDTPGMGHADPLLKPHLSQLNQCHGVQNVLVLSATSQYQMMKASLHSYRSANLKGCVLTKLDECASLGDAMSMLSEHHLSLSYITNGQSVPDDIATFKSSQLVSRAVAMLKEQKSHHLQAQQTI